MPRVKIAHPRCLLQARKTQLDGVAPSPSGSIPRKSETVMDASYDGLRPSEVVHLTTPDPAEQAPLVARSVTPPSPSGRGGTTLLRQRAPRSCTVFVMTPPNELTSEGGRDDRGVPCSRYPPPPGRALVVALLRAFRHGALRRPDAADTCG